MDLLSSFDHLLGTDSESISSNVGGSLNSISAIKLRAITADLEDNAEEASSGHETGSISPPEHQPFGNSGSIDSSRAPQDNSVPRMEAKQTGSIPIGGNLTLVGTISLSPLPLSLDPSNLSFGVNPTLHETNSESDTLEPDLVIQQSLLSAILEPLEGAHPSNGWKQNSLSSSDQELFPNQESPLNSLSAPSEKSSTWPQRRKHFFILSSAGKPIYSRYGSENEVTELMGIFQTIIAIVDDESDDGDVIDSFRAGMHLFVFKIMGPLYLVAVAATGEAEEELKRQLEFLHDQIISVTTQTQINRIFEKRSNYDLRQLLTGTDVLLSRTISSFRLSHLHMLSSPSNVFINPKLRIKLQKALSSPSQPSTASNTSSSSMSIPSHLLTTLLTTPSRLISSYRNPVHLHARDIFVIQNLIAAAANGAGFRAGEAWMPVCLPAFDSRGFVNIYVCCVLKCGADSGSGSGVESVFLGGNGVLGDGSLAVTGTRAGGAAGGRVHHDEEDVFLVAVSRDREGFFEISEYKEAVFQTLQANGALDELEDALLDNPYRLTDFEGIPSHVRHFLCRNKKKMQYSECRSAPPYTSAGDYDRLQLLYQTLFSKIVKPTEPAARPAKVVYLKGTHEAVVSLVTSSYDIFAAYHPLTSKQDAEDSTRLLYKWIKKMDGHLFCD
ncbi:Vacuolar fusion protein mon1b [Chytriomyces hyalinus]|nr:Vacuolar fusion protein mon1b [Chytriomyces hyalinus]